MSQHDVTSLAAITAFLLLCVLIARVIVVGRRLRSSGYRSGDVVVACRDGHVFTTIWIPLVSFKAVRLGLVRFQYCPVGEHWTFVTPIRPII